MADLYQSEEHQINNGKKRYEDNILSNQSFHCERLSTHPKKHWDNRYLGYRPSSVSSRYLPQRRSSSSSVSSRRRSLSRREQKRSERSKSLSEYRCKMKWGERNYNRKRGLVADRYSNKQKQPRMSSSVRVRQRRSDATDNPPSSYSEQPNGNGTECGIRARTPGDSQSHSRGRSRRHAKERYRHPGGESDRRSYSYTSASVVCEKGRKRWSSSSRRPKAHERYYNKQRARLHAWKTSPASSASSSYTRSRHRSRSSSLSYHSSYHDERKKVHDPHLKQRSKRRQGCTSRRTRTYEKKKRRSYSKKRKVTHVASSAKSRKRSCSEPTGSDTCSEQYKYNKNRRSRRKHRVRSCNSNDSRSKNHHTARKKRKTGTRRCRYYKDSSSSSDDSSSFHYWKRQRLRNHHNDTSSHHHSFSRRQPPHNPNPNVINNAVVSDEEVDRVRSNGMGSASSSHGDYNRDDTIGHYQGNPGSLISDRYEIVKDLGIGTFGRVLSCVDRRRRHLDEVAIKVVRDVKRYYESAQIEADILRHVNSRNDKRGTALCVQMLDHFHFLDGRHYCLVFESLGLSLYDFLKNNDFQPFPLYCVQDFSQQLLSAIEFLHSLNLIHTDLKPENILLVTRDTKKYKSNATVPASTRIKVIDFGGATYDDETKSTVINTRQYRAPEVILELPWSFPSDIWSLGCILAELYTGNLLFATHDNYEHLALIERAIGTFPRYMLDASASSISKRVFDSCGKFRGRLLSPPSKTHVERMLPIDNLVADQPEFLKLLKKLLVIDPHRRATASEALSLSFPKRSQLYF